MVDGLCPLQCCIKITVLAWQEAGSADERLDYRVFGRMVQCGGFHEIALEALY